MNKGGRPSDNVWQNFLKVEKEGKTGYAKCKYCENVQFGKVERMRKHLASCKSYLSTVKSATCTPPEPDIQSEIESENESVVPAKKLKTVTQLSMDMHVIKTSRSNAEKLNLLAAKFFYANNIPFSAVEHHTFKELMSEARPGYCPPSRKALAGELLDQVTTEVTSQTKKLIKGKQVTLIEDGWSNIHNDPVIATCVHSEGKSYFLDSIEAGTQTKNAQYHKKILEEAIEKAKKEFDCDVKSVVTDNARVMEKAKDLLCEADNSLVVYGCSAHYLNLLGQDITPVSVIQNIVKVQKYFRNHHIPSALLKNIQNSVKPQLPGDTRWKSQMTCIESFLRNRVAFQKILDDHEDEIDRDIAKLINDYNLYKQAKDTLAQLKPIAVSLDHLQSDNANISEACRTWLMLLNEECLQPRIAEVKKRFSQAVKPLHFLAYFLNPKYKGESLDILQKESARLWLIERFPMSTSLLISYEAEASPFPKTYFTTSGRGTNPVIWWSALETVLEQEGHSKDCLKFIQHLQSCPASSASIERMFSNFGLIHSKLRNRLGADTTAKLVMCYRMLRGPKELDY